MSAERQLRDFFERGGDEPRPAIDTALVIRRSRRRHIARQAAAGGAGTLAVAGIGIASVTGIQTLFGQLPTVTSIRDSAGSAPSAPGSTEFSKRAAADRLNLCAAPLAQVEPAASGLVLAVEFPASAAVSAESVRGTVVMTNTSQKRLTGSTAATPAVTLSQSGVTLWHSNGPMIMMAAIVDLGPGESMTYQASFTPVRCSAEDDLEQGFRAGLPRVSPGTYQLSAAIDFSTDTGAAELVTSPLASIRLN